MTLKIIIFLTYDIKIIIFLTYDIKNYYLLFVILFSFDILRRTSTFSERHSVFFIVVQQERHFWNLEFWRHF